jgi:predicted enzyme related to lactoylglutathione lyase
MKKMLGKNAVKDRKPRVHGVGGVFFKARDPAALASWYREHLDFEIANWGGALFNWKRVDTRANGCTVWAPFNHDSQYFAPSNKPFMINLRVDDLDATLGELRVEGCQVLDRREDSAQGKFGYVVDPEGTLLELWQAAAEDASSDADA